VSTGYDSVSKEPKSDAPAVGYVGSDFSLKSNGHTYIERDGEAAQILERIEQSSASVIGISGVRGAGKSSLAKKILDSCEARGYFTLLIPSPISYEPREFLLAIFQRVVESALQSMTGVIEGSEELVDAGREKAREVRRALIIVAAGIIFSFGAAIVLQSNYYKQYQAAELKQEQEEYQAARTRRFEAEKKNLTAKLSDLDAKIADPRSSTEDLKKFTEERDALNRELRFQEDDLIDFVRRRDRAALTAPITLFASAVVFYVIAVFLGIFVRGLFKRYRKFAAHPKEVGLLVTCREMLELITYQATLSSGKDVGLNVKWLSGKLTSNKQLAERPLSLPGLTATCSKFLSDLAEVFGLKVVICIDELDKITDAAQLMELLKGIKGILGQDRTHFLLTISEDAMGYFTERLSAERNLIESSFEQIVYLDRFPRDLARELIRKSVGADVSGGPKFQRNSDLLWIFAGGIPREIRRNIFTVHSARLNLGHASPIAVWKMLYLEMIAPMQINPPRSTSLESQFDFLRGLETLLVLVHGASEDSKFQDLMEGFSHIVTEWFKELLSPEVRENVKEFSQTPYLPLVAQIVVGFLCLGVVLPKSNEEDHMDSLVYVSKYVPINPRYALYGLRKFLGGRLKYLYEDTESTAGFEKAIEQVAPKELSQPAKGKRGREASRHTAVAG
jgi:hypothetical protein